MANQWQPFCKLTPCKSSFPCLDFELTTAQHPWNPTPGPVTTQKSPQEPGSQKAAIKCLELWPEASEWDGFLNGIEQGADNKLWPPNSPMYSPTPTPTKIELNISNLLMFPSPGKFLSNCQMPLALFVSQCRYFACLTVEATQIYDD